MGVAGFICPRCGNEDMIPILRTAYYLDYSVRCLSCGQVSSLEQLATQLRETELEVNSLFEP